MKPDIKITISGRQGAGKSGLIKLIGYTLRNRGIRVDFGEHNNEASSPPTQQVINQLSTRRIEIIEKTTAS